MRYPIAIHEGLNRSKAYPRCANHESVGTADGTSGLTPDLLDRVPPEDLRAEFLLDPEIVFLNHGSFGACPRDVFARYQQWQLELERRPIEFLARRLDRLLAEARATLAD